ncbi:MAG: class I SAM-dependent methyltransferase [Oscillospiraceae bacterium]|nr:class I SAM-dependent methyltransferase [Oscillospiraceae bacterium]
MMDSHGFNLWAGNYDKSVNVTDDDNEYPFAGYKELMNDIFNKAMNEKPETVLDIGIGTGTLAYKLYENGIQLTGIDFSKEMLDIAKEKMPKATLIEHDFTNDLPLEVQNKRYDLIISTYALHHLTDDEKAAFILRLLNQLNDDGVIIIGDVSFCSRNDLENCKQSCGDEWDDDEFYFVFTELEENLKKWCLLTYRQISHCAGILEIRPHSTIKS